jgi:AMP nucleosidase
MDKTQAEAEAQKILATVNEIYYNQQFYPKITIQRSWSDDNPEIYGELSTPMAYQFYLKQELTNLLLLGAKISVEASRPIVDDYDSKYLDWVDEQHLDLRNKKIFLFGPERIEFSVERLKHYTGTEIEDFQSRVLITNYAMHMEIFAKIFPDCVKPTHDVQMPTYHHKLPNNKGITITNIGVGPSNAKTFTDHLCVLKPDLMLMVGHCGGLRNNQKISDFVLANSYLRDDKVLDDILPIEVPVVPNHMLNEIIKDILEELRVDYRIGCVMSSADRNWEFRKEKYVKRIAASRSIGIDMESATIAANGYRYRVPNATLLMVSDKPLHGKIKRAETSKEFYQQSKELHLKTAIKVLDECLNRYPQGFPANIVRGLYDPLMISK